jgi:site-specific recombinase XerD
LGKILDGYCQWLLDRGYSCTSVRISIQRILHFDNYLAQTGSVVSTTLNADLIQAFLTECLPSYPCPRGGFLERIRTRSSIRSLTKYLRASGLICHTPMSSPPYQALLDEYLIWMRDYCHCAARTIDGRRRYLIPFLEHLGAAATKPKSLSKLSPDTMRTFLLDYARNHDDSRPKHVAAALRIFCRFCLYKGYIRRDLAFALPSFRRYRLSTIPDGITDEEARRVLCSIDRTTVAGRRDHAILQLLYTYGARAEQVSGLRLEDIRWAAGQLRFAPLKHGKTVVQPLTNDVGDSLLAYLQRGRPPSLHREVFMTLRAPYVPIHRQALPLIVGKRLQAAGIHIPGRRARVFRHGFATRVLAAGYSLKSIADMLGHRNIESASVYAKVDFHALEQVALEWPEEEP